MNVTSESGLISRSSAIEMKHTVRKSCITRAAVGEALATTETDGDGEDEKNRVVSSCIELTDDEGENDEIVPASTSHSERIQIPARRVADSSLCL